jgi:tetratricopeptide (TPR) repeat protein
VAKRFHDLFDAEPMLIYSLAQARAVQGRSEEAEALAQQAAGIRPEQIDLHAQSATRLRLRGQSRWAEAEYRLVIDQSPAGSFAALGAQRLLADMLYDLLDFGRAADLLDASVAAMRENIRLHRENENGASVEEMQGRALYLRAEQKLEQGDQAGRRELLEQALVQNPLDIDVLIALSNIKDLSPDTRNRVAQRIEQAAQAFRAEQSQSPHDATPYNQLAWLLANTDGDLDEALDGSRRSLELQPDEPAYLDTLGRVYYARGDLEAAIEQQSHAVELNPHSGLMRRQLELFQGALEKRRAAEPTTE